MLEQKFRISHLIETAFSTEREPINFKFETYNDDNFFKSIEYCKRNSLSFLKSVQTDIKYFNERSEKVIANDNIKEDYMY